MLLLAFRNLTRRPIRALLTLSGVGIAIGVMACLLAFGEGYGRELRHELDGMGVQMMLVPLGCPYDAAARVLKGSALDVSLPAASVDIARRDPAVACAAPLLLATVPRPSQGRTDLWVGVDPAIRPLKPWWKMQAGQAWFADDSSVILGAEAAATEMRNVGDTLYSPETGRSFRVSGILERSGTGDDSQFFVPLGVAQAMFHQPHRVTAVAIRLRDPALTAIAQRRLQTIPGAQVATMAEMLGVFLNLLGAVRTLTLAVAVIAIAISTLSVFTTMLTSVLERTGELGVLRAIGASRAQIFGLLTLEGLLLTTAGSVIGLLLARVGGSVVESLLRQTVSLAPSAPLLTLTGSLMARCVALGVIVGLAAGLYPAWQASRLQPAQALRAD